MPASRSWGGSAELRIFGFAIALDGMVVKNSEHVVYILAVQHHHEWCRIAIRAS